MSRLQSRPGQRWYGHDRQGDRYSRHSSVRPHGTDYSYERPRRMLVAVKEGMLHPKPPTYRRLDMDDSLHKMPIEHCRTSTSRSVDFESKRRKLRGRNSSNGDMYYSSQTQFPSMEGPRFNRGSVMLASAKEGLYHPRLPTFRRMDMDTVSQKLPYEHCRTTTALTRDDFRHAAVTLFKKTKEPLPEEFREGNENEKRPATDYGHPYSSLTRQSHRPHTKTGFGEDLRRMHPDKLGELFPAFRREPDESSFSNRYKFQYIPPRVFPAQYSKVHFVDWTGIRPIPANTYSRYRDAHPMYSENISSRSWRP